MGGSRVELTVKLADREAVYNLFEKLLYKNHVVKYTCNLTLFITYKYNYMFHNWLSQFK